MAKKKEIQITLRQELERALIALANKTFAATDQVNSVAISVAQYWSDEADDAVHMNLLYSNRTTPLLEHHCTYKETQASDFCGYCKPKTLPIERDDSLPWNDNDPETISAFEGYCAEDSEGDDYLTYAIVRRGEGIERVGRSVRPWLDQPEPIELQPPTAREAELLASVYASPNDDGPRAVLADWWLAREDPRSELIQLQLRGATDAKSKARETELLEMYGRVLLGAIGAAIPMTGAHFARGLLCEAEVLFPSEEALALAADPAWGTVERLHFLDNDHQQLHPSMRALRTVSGLSKRALQAAVASKDIYSVEDLAVNFSITEAIKILKGSSCFPRLQRIEGTLGKAKDFTKLAKPLPATVRCIGIADDPEELASLVGTLPSDREVEWVSRPERGRLAGWRYTVSRVGDQTRLRCVLDNLRADASIARVRAVRDAIAGEVLVELVPSRYYDPRPEDLAILDAAEAPEEAYG